MSVWPAVVSGGVSLLSGMLGIGASRSAEDRSWRRSQELMRRQNQFNVNMWNRSNEYNTPSNQMRLLKEAGINPAMYDFAGGNSAASEVTAASGEVPNNSQIGQLYQNLDPSQKVIQSLQTDAQIQKLRTDIAYQKLLNRDFQNELSAREELLPVPLSETDFYYDKDGNPVVEVTPGKNSYQEQRAHRRLDLGTAAYNQELTANELEVYQAGMPFLKKMPQQQLRKLQADITSATFSNSLLAQEVKLMKEYGISPNDKDGWQSFLKAILRNPDAISNVFDQFFRAGSSTYQRGSQRIRGYGYSHSNPRSGSW